MKSIPGCVYNSTDLYKRNRRLKLFPNKPSSWTSQQTQPTMASSESIPSKVLKSVISVVGSVWHTSLQNTSFETKETITFLVGSEQRSFSVHKSLMYKHSRHIKAAIESSFAENEQQSFSLPDHNCKTFASFVEWVYKGKVKLPETKHRDDDETPVDEEGDDFWWALGRLYILADYLEAHKLKKRLVNMVFTNGQIPKSKPATDVCGPSSGMIGHLYRNTVHGCPLRALLVHWYVWNLDQSWWEKGIDAQNYLLETQAEEFTTDIAIESMRRMYTSIKKDTSHNPFKKYHHDYYDEAMRLVGSTLQSDHHRLNWVAGSMGVDGRTSQLHQRTWSASSPSSSWRYHTKSLKGFNDNFRFLPWKCSDLSLLQRYVISHWLSTGIRTSNELLWTLITDSLATDLSGSTTS